MGVSKGTHVLVSLYDGQCIEAVNIVYLWNRLTLHLEYELLLNNFKFKKKIILKKYNLDKYTCTSLFTKS